MEKGVIVRVTGPLVVARDLKDVKMHEVVRVGDIGLIGEVVEIRGEDVYIQVYEETSGIGPGERVIRTGEPLSVELGPGLLSTIYDGIQRPLERIRDEFGSYIVRGVNIPGLDRNKKWRFTPIRKKGEVVSEGDIIGEVEETGAIKHKIMIPPGIGGKIVEINEGEFTVLDTVAKVEKDGKVFDIRMMQRWPVRDQRPIKKKLKTDEPLITGTRVIDTFFTITKGGTAAIPGPFGSGKCVSPETPVLLSTGDLLPIKEIYERYKNDGVKKKNGDEEYTIINKPLCVFGLSHGKIKPFRVRAVYKGKTDFLIKIKTRSGREFKITPVHKLFKFHDIEIKKTPAVELKEGDFLVMPRIIPEVNKNGEVIDWRNIFKDFRIIEGKDFMKFCKEVGKLRKKYKSLKKVSEVLKINYDTLISYWCKKNNPTLDSFFKVFNLSETLPPDVNYLKGETTSKPVKIPKKMDEKLALFLGLITGDGQVKGRSIRFYTNDEELKHLFRTLVREIFSLSTKEYKMKTVDVLIVESPVVKRLLDYFGFPEYKKSKRVGLPKGILSMSKSIMAQFLSGYFLCDGYFNEKRGEIEIATSSKNLFTGLCYLLLFLGIKASFKYRKMRNYENWRIFIRGKDEIKRFYENCATDIEKYKRIERYLLSSRRKYNSWDIVPLSREFVDRIYRGLGLNYTKLKKEGIEIHNYLGGENMGREVFEKIAVLSRDEQLINFVRNHLSSIFIDRIEKIEWIKKRQDVYDLEVENAHNFIGGDVPSFFSNTVILHQLAKWSDADIIVYIGCGERGNEMTDVLTEFPELKDPRTGRSLMERTVLIANTSNMPVAAREASIYTGITIAEYFRDMGYKVALMADSTSRWAEALREMSGRMEEMPGEEGYPAYLGTRIAEFYERAGKVVCLGSDGRIGALSAIGAVSPPGGDLSDPVVQNTLRVVKVFWSLEDKLAFQRHFPAISWLRSYSLYIDNIKKWSEENLGSDFISLRAKALEILQKEDSLIEVVRLVGMEALSEEDKLILDTAKMIREDFLSQHAFDPEDTYTFIDKQYMMLKIIITFHHKLKELISSGKKLDEYKDIPIREKIARMKYVKHEDFKGIFEKITEEIERLK
ncbi:MAG: V-type ATP synthase subunit A [Caldiserica bacterium]|nr:MAG: V-type ATP synthase subunit A [Caldisericota bacterium]